MKLLSKTIQNNLVEQEKITTGKIDNSCLSPSGKAERRQAGYN